MHTELSSREQTELLRRQLENLVPDGRAVGDLRRVVRMALERVERCFSKIVLAPFRSSGGGPRFDHLHADQYAAFLYFASNCAWRDLEDIRLASKLFVLNKSLNGIVIMYDTLLPDIFLLNHTVGTVLGKATYSDYFVAYQNVGVGTDRGMKPVLGRGTVIYAGASVIGETVTGVNVTISAHSCLRNEGNVAADCVVAGTSPNLIIRPAKKRFVDRYFFDSAAPE